MGMHRYIEYLDQQRSKRKKKVISPQNREFRDKILMSVREKSAERAEKFKLQDNDNDNSVPDNNIKESALMNDEKFLTIEEIDAGTKEALHKMDSTINAGIFTGKTVNMTIIEAANRPVPRKLWKELWFENELCILFADTNLGKSIYSVQIAEEISKTDKVVLFDFELSDKQFQIRYCSTGGLPYQFSDNFYRFEMNSDSNFSDDAMEKQINEGIKSVIEKTDAKIIIIDNITYLSVETEKSKSTLPLMKNLKKLKDKNELSILCLAHTPKRDLSKPITRNDLAGSKTLINFCDSAFAIGESAKDNSVRYVKQIKSRNCEIKHDSENVILYCITKENDNFLKFAFIRYCSERELLKESSENEKEVINEMVLDLDKKGLSLREIGKELGISHTKVSRILNKKKTAPNNEV